MGLFTFRRTSSVVALWTEKGNENSLTKWFCHFHSIHPRYGLSQSLTGWLVLMFFHHITCLCCVRTMMVSLIKLYVIHSGEPQQQQQLRRKYNNNEMRNELRGASMKGQEAVERGALSVASGWWGCCSCYSCCCCSCGWVFARKRELIILTRILGRPRGFI